MTGAAELWAAASQSPIFLVAVFAVSFLVGWLVPWPEAFRRRRSVLPAAMPEGAAEAMLVTGCCIGLGWDGRGPMPRKLRREAVRRLEVAIGRISAGGKL